MPSDRLDAVVDYLRRVSAPAAAAPSDDLLLERFATRRDEAAFAALVERHGPLVWGVCRRVLGQVHDAEDAFQATFLVLVRKARSISKRASVRSWLYGVAHRVAVRARTTSAQRSSRERRAARAAHVAPDPEADRHEVRAILDEEVNRLPERQRLPVILCYLEGKTNDEAARQLGCPRGTIATQLRGHGSGFGTGWPAAGWLSPQPPSPRSCFKKRRRRPCPLRWWARRSAPPVFALDKRQE